MAHGLELRMKNMLEQHKVNENGPATSKVPPFYRNEAATEVYDDVRLIQSWIMAMRHPKNSKIEYFTLLRQTLLLMLTPKWKQSKQVDVLYAYKSYVMKFSTITHNCTDVYHAVLKIAENPWHNSHISWDQIFKGTAAVDDVGVTNYFASEPEQVVLGRVHALVLQKHVNPAYNLAKMSFLYNSRVAGYLNPSRQRSDSKEETSKVGHASIDWLSFLMQKTMSFDEILTEVKQFNCHEGIEIITRLRRDPSNMKFCFTVLQVVLLEDLIRPSQYCCTKKLFVMFCVMHKEVRSSAKHISESARKIFSKYAPSSSHLYLFVDVLWKQYGTECLDLCVEMYVRALTADINHLEAKKDSGSSIDVASLETHLATVFAKLSTLFSGLLDVAARECMFSAFSLRPTKERLCTLQSLTQNLLSNDHKERSTLSGYEIAGTNCNCRVKCSGTCRARQKVHVLNPLLNMDSKTISYHLIKDLVCVLENARNIKFQYNFFDWQNNSADLGEYLKAYNLNKAALKDWGSDTEVASEGSGRSDLEDTNSVIESRAKRKSNSLDINPISALEVAANIEVESNDGLNKRIKMSDPCVENQLPRTSEAGRQYPQLISGAIETLIRATLSENTPKGQSSKYMVSVKSSKETCSDARSNKLLEGNRQSPSNMVHPYSLTDHGKRENLGAPSHLSNKSIMRRIKSSIECQNNFMTHYSNEKSPAFSSASSAVSRQSVVITPPSNRTVDKPIFAQKQAAQKTPYTIQSSVVNPVYKQVKVNDSYKMQNVTENASKEGALNLSYSSDAQKDKQLLKFHALTSQFVSSQPSPKTANIDHLKQSSFPNSTSNQFHSKQQSSHDRNSVIQHTMQHVREMPIPISREVVVSLDSSELKKLHSNESEFCINVSKEIDFKPDQLATGTLKINRQPHLQPPSPFKNETISIPGIISSPLRNNQKLQFTKLKNSTTINTTITSSVKKVYHKPYTRAMPTASKPQVEPLTNTIHTTYDGRGGIQMPKSQQSIQESSWTGEQISSSNNSLASSSSQSKQWQIRNAITSGVQQWNMPTTITSVNQLNVGRAVSYNSHPQLSSNKTFDSANKTLVSSQLSSSSHSTATSSNQAWYSKPYPQSSSYNPSTSFSNKVAGSVGGVVHTTPASYSMTKSLTHPNDSKYPTSTSLLKSRLSGSQVFSSTVPNSSKVHQRKDISTYSETYGYNQKQFSSQGNVQASSSLAHLPTSSTVTSNYSASSHCDRPHQIENHRNLNTHNNPALSSDERGVFRPTNNAHLPNLHSLSPSSSSKTCCSPIEVDPCQTCSPTGKSINEPSKPHHSSSGERNPYQVSDGTSFDVAVSSVTNHSTSITEEPEDKVIECKLCRFSVPASLMEMHIDESHPNMQLNRENYKSFTVEPHEFSDSLLPSTESFFTDNKDIAPIQSLTSDKPNYWTSTASEEQSTSEQYALQDKTKLYSEHNVKKNENDQPLPQMDFFTDALLHDSTQSFSEMVKDASNIEKCIAHQNSTSFSKEVTTEATMLDSKFFNPKQELEKSWSNDPKNNFNQLLSDEEHLENSSKASMSDGDMNFDRRIREASNKLVTPENIVFCTICNKKLRSNLALKRHMTSFHKLHKKDLTQPTVSDNPPSSNLCVPDRSDSMQQSLEYEFDSSVPDNLRTKSYQSIHNEKLGMKPNSDITSNPGIDVKSQAEGRKFKNKLKGLKALCQYCGKSLTMLYMKTHILKKHKEVHQLQDNNSNQNTSSASKDNELAFPTVSTLLQDDINTRTCLSPSDALNTDNRFDIEARGGMSDSSVKTASASENFPLQATQSNKKNTLSKFKLINKASPMTLKQFEDQKEAFTSENELQPKLTEDYRCHVCFRKYISKAFLNKHLQTFHNLSASQINQSNSSQKSPDMKSESTFPEFKQGNKETLNDECKLNSRENSDLPPAENSVLLTKDNYNSSANSEPFYSEQINAFDNNNTNEDSKSQLLELEMQNSSHNSFTSGVKQTIPEKVKNKIPKNFRCTLCKRDFSYSKNLQNHNKKHHSSIVSLENDDSSFQTSNSQVNNQESYHNMEPPDNKSNSNDLEHHETSAHRKEFLSVTQDEILLNYGSYSSSNPSDKVSLSKSDSFFNSNGCSSDDLTYQNDLSRGVEKLSTDAGAYSEKLSFSDIHINPSTSSKQIVSACSSYNENLSYDSFDQNENNAFYSISNEIDGGSPKSKLFTDMLKDSPDTNDPYQTNSFTASSSQSMMQNMSPIYVQQSNINLETSSVSTESNECPVCFKKMSTQDQLQHHIEKLHPLSTTDAIDTHEVNKSIESQNQNMFSELQHIYPVVNSLVTTANKGIYEDAPFLSSYNQNIPTDENDKNKHELLYSEFCNSNNFPNLDHSSMKDFQRDATSTYSKELYSASTTSKTEFPEKETEHFNEQDKNTINDASASHVIEHEDGKHLQKCDIFNIEPIMLAEDNDSALKHALMFSELLDEFEAHTNPSIDTRGKFESGEYEQLRSENVKDCCDTSTQNSSLVDNFISPHSEDISAKNSLNNSSEKSDSKIDEYFCKSENNFDLPETAAQSVTMHDIFSDKFLDEKPCSSSFQCEKQVNADPSSYSNLNSFLENEIQKCGYIAPVSSQVLPTEHEGTINELSLAICSFEDKNQSKADTDKDNSLNNIQEFLESGEMVDELSLLLHSDDKNTTQSFMNITDVSNKTNRFLTISEEPPVIIESNVLDCNSSVNAKKTLMDPKNTEPMSKATKSIARQRKPSLQGEYICTICSKKLSQPWSLKRHILKQHPGALPIDNNTVLSSTDCLKSSSNDVSKELNTSLCRINQDFRQNNLHQDQQSVTSSSTESCINLSHNKKNCDKHKTDSTVKQECFGSPLVPENNSPNSIVKSSLLLKDNDTNVILHNGTVSSKRKSFAKKKCLICSKELCDSTSLKRHMKRLHPEVIEVTKLNSPGCTSDAKSFTVDQKECGTLLNTILNKDADSLLTNLQLSPSSSEGVDETFFPSDNLMPLSSMNCSLGHNVIATNVNSQHDEFEHITLNSKEVSSLAKENQIQCQSVKSKNLSEIEPKESLEDSKKKVTSEDSIHHPSDQASFNVHSELYSAVSPVSYSLSSVSNKCISSDSNQNVDLLYEGNTLAAKLNSETFLDNNLSSKFTNAGSPETYNPSESILDKIKSKNCLNDSQSNQQIDIINLTDSIKIQNISKQPSKTFPPDCSGKFNDLTISNLEETKNGLATNIEYNKTKVQQNQIESLSQSNDSECLVNVPLVADDNKSPPKEILSDLQSQSEITETSIVEKQLNLQKNPSKITLSEVSEDEHQPILSEIIEETKAKLNVKPECLVPVMVKVQSPTTPLTSVSLTEENCFSSKKCSSSSKLKISSVKTCMKIQNPVYSSKKEKSLIQCRVCHKTFSKPGTLACHLKRVHKLPFLKKQSPSKPSKINKNKLSPPKLSIDSCYEFNPTLNVNKQVHETKKEPPDLDTPSIKCAEEPGHVNDQDRVIKKAKRMLLLETNKNPPEDNQNEVELLSTNQNTCEKNSGAKDNNFIKRRSQRSSSCEIIEVICKKTIRYKRPFKSARDIDVTDTKKKLQKSKNRCSLNKSCIVPIDKNKKTHITSKAIQSCESSIPKCIIKVCKDEKNSVFYQSLNNIESEGSPKNLDNKTGKMSKKITQISNVSAKSCSYRRRKRHTVLLSTLGSRRRFGLSNSASSNNTALKPKNKTRKTIVNHPLQKCHRNDSASRENAPLQSEESVKETQGSVNIIRTFKDPEDIERFLAEHKQPLVCIKRLTNRCVKDANKPCNKFSIPTFQLNKLPVVRLTRIDALNSVSSITLQNYSLNGIVHKSTSQGETNKIIENQSMTSSDISPKPTDLNDNDGRTSSNYEIPSCSTNQPSIGTNANNLDSQCSRSAENRNTEVSSLPLLKKCSVLLSKLPF